MRTVSRLFVAVALVVFVGGSALAGGQPARQDQTHEGKIVKVEEGKLTMTDREGGNRHTHKVSAIAKITCDGRECKLTDLKDGYWVKVSTKNDDQRTVTRVEAKVKREL